MQRERLGEDVAARLGTERGEALGFFRGHGGEFALHAVEFGEADEFAAGDLVEAEAVAVAGLSDLRRFLATEARETGGRTNDALRYAFDRAADNMEAHFAGEPSALPRILASLLENHQTANGIQIPKALQAYTGFSVIE